MIWNELAPIILLAAPHDRPEVLGFAARCIAQKMIEHGHGTDAIMDQVASLIAEFKTAAPLEDHGVRH